ncbi:hypothetical protein OAD76_00055 [Flavobacteriaceae bacterium]|nr:hypothetical protein [Flavobacteriaceae bacterium]
MQSKKVTSEKVRVKQVIVLALLFMMIGTLLELYLLDHYEDTWQLIPILCIGAALVNLFILFFRRSQVVITLFKLVLVLTSFSGIYGVVLHLQANYEFEQDMKPTAYFWELFSESLSGALPTLAPMSLLVLAFIGYSYLILIKQHNEKI